MCDDCKRRFFELNPEAQQIVTNTLRESLRACIAEALVTNPRVVLVGSLIGAAHGHVAAMRAHVEAIESVAKEAREAFDRDFAGKSEEEAARIMAEKRAAAEAILRPTAAGTA